MKEIISKSILLTIGVMIISFGFKIYLSYLILKEDLGIFYTMIDISSVFVLIFSGYKDSIIKAVSDRSVNYLYKKIVQNYTFMTLLSLCGLYYIYKDVNGNILNPASLLLFFIATQVSNFYSYLNVAYRNYNSMLYEKTVKALFLVLSFIILNLFISDLTALIFAYIIQLVAHTIYIFITSKKIFYIQSNGFKKNLYKNFLKNYMLSTGTSLLGSISTYISAIIMFYLFADNSKVAEYQIVVKSIFFALVAIFVHPVAAYTFPEVSSLITEKKFYAVKRINNKLVKYLIVFMFLVILSLLFTKSMIGLIFPKNYIDSYKMLNIILPMLPIIVYTSFSINIIKAFDRFDLALYVRLFGAILFFVSIYIFYLMDFEASSIVYSLDLSFMGMFILSYYYKRKLLV